LSLPAQTVRFGPFQLDLRAAELHHNGTKTKLPEQPFQILCELVEHPGEVVTREELRQRLWRSDTFVDFEHGLNTAVKRLREALGDSAENPRYIETLPRHGYRLMVAVEKPVAPILEARTRGWRIWLAAAAVMMVVAVVAGLLWRSPLLERLRPIKIESLAVLPLENISGNPDEEYFADGMTQALITELGKVQALRVISWQSVKQFKGTKKTVPQIARELRVDAVVEGSAMRAKDKVRITTQLVQANPERNLWSESYERDLRDVLALQGDVAHAITAEIKIKVTPQEHTRLANRHPVSPEAYEAYLKGAYYLEKRTTDDVRRAITSFQHAIEIDPNYAMGYAGLAEAYVIASSGFAVLTVAESFSKAEAATSKALELDETLAVPHALLARIRDQRDRDWAAAEKEYKHALDLEPGNAKVHYSYGFGHLVPLERFDEGIAEIRRALELAPLSLMIRTQLGNALNQRDLFRGGSYDEGIQQCREALELDSNFPIAHECLAAAYSAKGMYEEAVTELSKCVGAGAQCSRRLGEVYALSGRRTEAMKVLREMTRLYEKQPEEVWNLAMLNAALGNRDQAFVWLEKAYERQELSIMYVRICTVAPVCKQLSSDPRFQDLVRRMNFPP
jgi:TolB-like protein/DNA-binding winged helix-turn-helix (wHTH) protein/Tfp pilus assembly protein PilF